MQTAPHLDVLRAQARALPETPGVYFWRDGQNRILYIGKAVNLRARVTSYFSSARHDPRLRQLLSRSRTIQYEVTSSELQALFRESALIKQEQPRYNRALLAPRKAHYFKLDTSKDDPYIETTREAREDGSLYFGPFRSAAVMRETIQYVQDVLPLRKCTRANPRCRPCLYYQMHKCAGPLIDEEHRRQHQQAMDKLQELMDGRADRVRQWLESKRDRLSDLLLFERAAEVQQRLDALDLLLRKQTILEVAAQSRCVLIHKGPDRHEGPRLLLVAHGNVVSQRRADDLEIEDVVRWLRAHEPLIRAVRNQQSDLDAASVLERWLVVHRENVVWVAIPHDAAEEDLQDRVRYVCSASF